MSLQRNDKLEDDGDLKSKDLRFRYLQCVGNVYLH